MSNVDLSDYIEVPERIRDFIEKYPDGSLQCKTVEYRDLPTPNGDSKPHIIYHALAYRTADDRRPGHGMASEPLPGLTPYTKGSELMNAETSAWGRALAAIGFVSKRDGSTGVATAHEVRTRQTAGRTAQGVVATEKQVGFLKKLIKQKKPSEAQLNFMLIEVGAQGVAVRDGWTESLPVAVASGLIEWLKDRPLPDTENPSDVPYGEPPPVEAASGEQGDLPWSGEAA